MATSIGKHTYGANNLNVMWRSEEAQLRIGDYCSLAKNITIMLGGNHRTDWISTYPFMVFLPTAKDIVGHPSTKGNVIIGNDVWIGTNTTILSGVTIGDGAVIGMNSTVSKDVPPYAIVVGNPARIIKYRFTSDQIEKLLQIKWWNKDEEWINQNCHLLCSSDIDKFIDMCKTI